MLATPPNPIPKVAVTGGVDLAPPDPNKISVVGGVDLEPPNLNRIAVTREVDLAPPNSNNPNKTAVSGFESPLPNPMSNDAVSGVESSLPNFTVFGPEKEPRSRIGNLFRNLRDRRLHPTGLDEPIIVPGEIPLSPETTTPNLLPSPAIPSLPQFLPPIPGNPPK
jgi:hypothetical protein